MDDADHTTLYLRGVPRSVVNEAKVAAARQGTTLTAWITDAVRRCLGANTTTELGDCLEADFAWFAAHRERLLPKYEGDYVAIIDGKVIDHDRSFAALAERVFHREGMRSVFIPKVTRAEPVVRVHSPRRRRA
jgi:hypothetical protein